MGFELLVTSATLQQPTHAPWTPWLAMARVSNTPTVASNVLAGAALAGIVQPRPEIALLVLAAVVLYTAGMVLNDVCDFGWDRLHRPDRPLVKGLVSYRAALTAAVGLLALGGVLLLPLGVAPFLAGLLLIGCIVLYDVWHKSNPLSPLVMAMCRLMVYVISFVAFIWPPDLLLALGGGALVLYLVVLTAIAKRGAPGNVVALLIAGISLLDAVVLTLMQAPLPWIGVAVLCFGLTLLFQRYVEGT
jgi:4-hydroxybenzoate polyprenyltransferase